MASESGRSERDGSTTTIIMPCGERTSDRVDLSSAQGRSVRASTKLLEQREGETTPLRAEIKRGGVLEPRATGGVDADDEFVTTDAKDALTQDTKDAVAAELEQPAGDWRRRVQPSAPYHER